jgi:hypothetical protein
VPAFFAFAKQQMLPCENKRNSGDSPHCHIVFAMIQAVERTAAALLRVKSIYFTFFMVPVLPVTPSRS